MNRVRFINCQRKGVKWVNATLVLACSDTRKKVNKQRKKNTSMDRLSVNKADHYSLEKGKSPKILNRRHVLLISDGRIWRPYRKGYARNERSDFWQAPNVSIISLRSKAYLFSFKLLGLKRD